MDEMKASIDQLRLMVKKRTEDLVRAPLPQMQEPEPVPGPSGLTSNIVPKTMHVKEEGSNVVITVSGRSVKLPVDVWTMCQKAATPTIMAKNLVRAAFPTDVLLKSTYRGQTTKVGIHKGKKWNALDSNTLVVLKDVVQIKHKEFTDVLFGMAVNSKLSELRKKFQMSGDATTPPTNADEGNESEDSVKEHDNADDLDGQNKDSGDEGFVLSEDEGGKVDHVEIEESTYKSDPEHEDGDSDA